MFDVVKMTVAPEAGRVVPGGRLTLALVLRNASAIVDRYHVAVTGVPPEWVTLDKTVVSLFPGASERVMLTVAPPAGVATAAGDYPITIVATSEDDPTAQARRAVALEIGSVGQLGMDLLPPDTEGREGTFRVTLTNGSNQARTVALRARDNEEGLTFVQEPEGPLAVPAGGERVVLVRARPTVRETIGEPHPYDIEFTGVVEGVDAGDPQAALLAALLVRQGRYTYHPRFTALMAPPWLRRLPMWALMALLLLLLLLLSLAGNGVAAALAKPAPTPSPKVTAKTTPISTVAAARATSPVAAATRASGRTATPAVSPLPTAGTGPVVAGAVPRVNSFAARVGRDGSIVLGWAVAHARTVLIDGKPVRLDGSRTLHITRPTTLVLSAIGPGGAVTQMLQVVPQAGAPIVLDGARTARALPAIQQFTAGTDAANGRLALTWTVAGATRVTLNGVSVGSVASKDITLGDGQKYVLRATNGLGTVTETVVLPRQAPHSTVTRIVLHPPTIGRFALVHDAGTDTYRLSWTTNGAAGVTLNGTAVAANGSFTPSLPLQSGAYQLVASNRDGTATARVSVVVQPATPSTRIYTFTGPRIVTFALRRINGKLYVVWQVSGASRVTLQGKPVSSSGQSEVPTGTLLKDIRLTATNDAGDAQRDLILPSTPAVATPVPAATATPIAPTATPIAPTVTPIAPTATRASALEATNTPRPAATMTVAPSATGTMSPPATDTAPPSATRTAIRSHPLVAPPTPTATARPVPTDTVGPPATDTPRPVATHTPAPSPTRTATARPTATHTPAPRATATATATGPSVPAATNTPAPAATSTPAPTVTSTSAPTVTSTSPPIATRTTVPPPLLGSFGASPSSVTFGNVLVGGAASQAVAVSNSGPGNLSITNITIGGANPGDFTMVANSCQGLALASGASCTMTVSFAPTTTGPRAATLTVADDAPGGPHNLSLGGTGITRALTLSPGSLTFGPQPLGTVSGARTVTVANTGTDVVAIGSVTVDGADNGDYSATSSCGATLAPAATCAIGVVFAPAAIGSRVATLHLADNAAGSPQGVDLGGTGTDPRARVTMGGAVVNNLAFADQLLGTSSAPRTMNVTNVGTTNLSIFRVRLEGSNPGDYIESDACTGLALAPGVSCPLVVAFHPTAIGGRPATLRIDDDDPASPQYVDLAGAGIDPIVSLTPGSLSFGDQPLGTASAPKIVTLKNTGTTSLSIGGITVTGGATGDFAPSSACGATVAPGASCAISVVFAPTAILTRTAALQIADNAAGGAQQVPLTGNGTDPRATFGPPALEFGEEYIPDLELGTATVTKSVALTNTGTTALVIGSVTVDGVNAGDVAPSGCGAGTRLDPGAACTVNVAFSPRAIGDRDANLVVADNAADTPQRVPLHGVGINPQGLPAPATVDFNTAILGTSVTKTVALTNTGTSDLRVSRVIIQGATAPGAPFDDFSTNTSACPATLAPGAACVIAVTFTPTRTDPIASPRADLLEIDDNTRFNGGRQFVQLRGTGRNPAPAITPPSPPGLAFGDVPLGGSRTGSITISNTGPANLSITGLTIDGPAACDFQSCPVAPPLAPRAAGSGPGASASARMGRASADWSAAVRGGAVHANALPACATPMSLAPGASCAISVTFAPKAILTRTATLHLTDDAVDSPQGVTLSGFGTDGRATFNPPALSFQNPGVAVSDTATRTITLSSTGTTPLDVGALTVADPSALGYGESDDCQGRAIDPGRTCTVTVTLTPVTVGASATAQLRIVDNSLAGLETLGITATTGRPTTLFLGADGASFGQRPATGAITFTNVLSGTASATRTVYLANDSGTSSNPNNVPYELILPANAVTLGGANPADFTVNADGCSAQGAPVRRVDPYDSNCPVTVSFTPHGGATGPLSATLTFNDNASDGPQVLTLYGTAKATTVKVRPSTLDTFYPCNGGYFNAPCETRVVTVTNTGPSTLTVSGVTPSDNQFTITDDQCSGRSIPVSGTCAVGVTLNTAVVSPLYNSGVYSGTSALRISDNGIDAGDASPQIVPLEWSDVGVTPRALDFGRSPVNVPGITRTVTVSVYDGLYPTITGVTIGGDSPGDYGIVADGCTGRGLYYSSCTITVGFTPTVAGSRPADLLITDNRTPFAHDVTLDGVGSPVGASLTPPAHDYGTATVADTASAPVYTYTLMAQGINNLQVYSTTIVGPDGGDFGIRPATPNACQAEALAPGASCAVVVAFAPTDTLTRTATLLVYDNAPDSPQAVPLSGVGMRPSATYQYPYNYYPAAGDFGRALDNTQGSTMTIPLVDDGPGRLVIPANAVSLTGPNAANFHIDVDGCSGQVVALSAQCNVVARFTPRAAVTGLVTATLTITDNASNTPQMLLLQGTVATQVSVSPGSLDFAASCHPSPTGSVTCDSTTGTVTVTNTGPATLEGITPTIGADRPNTDDFTVTATTCGGAIAPNASCSISLQLADPAGENGTGQVRTANLYLNDDAFDSQGNNPQVVALAAPPLTFSPRFVAFGTVGFGTFNTITVTVTRVGAAPVTFQQAGVQNDESNTPSDMPAFHIDQGSDSCSNTTRNQGGTCQIAVDFQGNNPSISTYTGRLVITDTVTGSPQVIQLTATTSNSNNTPELGSGELVSLVLVPLACYVLYRRRRRQYWGSTGDTSRL